MNWGQLPTVVLAASAIQISGCATHPIPLTKEEIELVAPVSREAFCAADVASSSSLKACAATNHRSELLNALLMPCVHYREGLGSGPCVVRNNATLLNELKADYYNRRESTWVRQVGSGQERPEVCLALSGGGIRAGAFSLGVMSGLYEGRKDMDIDIVSVVSGSSYTLGSVWSCLLPKPNEDNAMASVTSGEICSGRRSFREIVTDQRFARLLAESADRNGWPAPYRGILWLIGDFFPNLYRKFWLASSPFPSIDSLRLHYMDTIKETWLFPAPKLEMWEIGSYVEDSKKRAAEFRAPYPIINASALAKSDFEFACRDKKLATVWEITADRVGNSVYGYRPVPRGAFGTLSGFIAVSGAATDTPCAPEENKSLNFLPGRLSATVGVYEGSAEVAGIDGLPARRAEQLYFTDGGASDNLGAYSVVARNCKTIVIVDGEEDQSLRFEAYHELKTRLKADFGYDLRVKGIDSRVPAVSSRGDALETRVKKCHSFPAQRTNDVVFEGTITGRRPDEDRDATNVVYVKLAIDCENAPLEVREFVRSSGHGDFPQDKTKNQSYEPERFLAYYDLGRVRGKAASNLSSMTKRNY